MLHDAEAAFIDIMFVIVIAIWSIPETIGEDEEIQIWGEDASQPLGGTRAVHAGRGLMVTAAREQEAPDVGRLEMTMPTRGMHEGDSCRKSCA